MAAPGLVTELTADGHGNKRGCRALAQASHGWREDLMTSGLYQADNAARLLQHTVPVFVTNATGTAPIPGLLPG